MRVRVAGEEREVDTRVDADAVVVIVEGQETRVPFRRCASGRVELLLEGRWIGAWSDGRSTWVDGHSVQVERVAARGPRADTGASLASPMPATVVAVKVGAGERVSAGQACVVVSAMKTEIVLRSPRAGVVRAVLVQAGAAVRAGEATCELEVEDAG